MRRGAPYDPYRHADELGLRVETVPFSPHDGLWLPRRNLILLRSGMKAIQERCVLAHEIGHAVHGHLGDGPRDEAVADRYAAECLIDRDHLLDLMAWSPDAGRWSLELDVTTRMLAVYLELHRLELASRSAAA